MKQSLMGLYYNAKEMGADIVLFGHSHLYGAEMKDGILFLNPGSTMLADGRERSRRMQLWNGMKRFVYHSKIWRMKQ